MDAPFLAGAVAGYAIAIPVGAIAVLIIETGLRRGFRAAFAAGAGAATADGIYATLAMVAGAAIAVALEPLTRPLRIVAGFVLLGIAARSFVAARRPPRSGLLETPVGRKGAAGLYVRFTGLTLLNPSTVIYFAALILGLPRIGVDFGASVAFIAGAFLASLSWQTLLAVVSAEGHRRLPPGFRNVLGLVGSVVIAGFAIAILREAFAA